MTSEANTGQGVAAVVARVASAWRNTPKPYPVQPRSVMDDLVRALDAAGLLLTAARRERIVEFIQHAGPEYIDPVSAERHERHRDALLRELAGDGGAPRVVCPLPSDHAGPCEQPKPAPRRMAANPTCARDNEHGVEHDWFWECDKTPLCQPVAAAPHDPRDFDPGAGGPMGVLPADAAPAHEHRWAAVAWVHELFYRNDALGTREWRACGRAGAERMRVTREHCTRGDCTATREVGHGA